MKKKNIFLFALAIVLILATSISGALAYFTTYANAKGGYVIHLGYDTEITETFSNWTKHVTITNREGSQPVYVRARAFSGSTYDLNYTDMSGKWSMGKDGYWYYEDVLYAGESSTELLVKINNVPDNVTDGASFNVVVIYEATPVQYDASGNPYADWNAKLDTSN